MSPAKRLWLDRRNERRRRERAERRAARRAMRFTRPAGMHPLAWMRQQAILDVGIAGTPATCDDIGKRQSWLRRVSQAFHLRLERAGYDIGVVVERPRAESARRMPTSARRVEAQEQELSGHVPTVIVPHGWTVEEDRREELLALSELVAMRKVG